ncbi:hypothetical protein SANTM175S_03939 [Streptomyces antimycoticus]
MGRVGTSVRGHARRTGTVAVAVAAAALCLTAPAEARPAAADDPSYSATTSVGVHNAYEKAKYPYFADALDSGASLLELDVWTNAFGAGWRVSHSNPLGNDNNCENATGPDQLRTKPRDQSLTGCLADMRAWHEAHPGHRPVFIKVEMKDGFYGKSGTRPGRPRHPPRRHAGRRAAAPGRCGGRPRRPRRGGAGGRLAVPFRARGQVHRRADPGHGRGEQPAGHAVDRP